MAAAAKEAAACGVEVRLLGDALEGEARDLGRHQAQFALDIQNAMHPSAQPVLLLSDGECTVTRRGNGIGGPNAEFTLSAAIALDGHIGVLVLACDTDGVDGAAEVAGAYAGPETPALAHQRGIDPPNALKTNDAHSFFERQAAKLSRVGHLPM